MKNIKPIIIYNIIKGGEIVNLDLILKHATFTDDKVREDLIKIHPKQIINRIDNINIMLYEVKYQYTTVRNNRKEGVKIFMLNTSSPEKDMKPELEMYIRDYNKENTSRQLLNVKFLESKCLDLIRI